MALKTNIEKAQVIMDSLKKQHYCLVGLSVYSINSFLLGLPKDYTDHHKLIILKKWLSKRECELI